MKAIDLNVDIGEGYPHDSALLNFATSANICCGVHAGSAELTAETVELCRVKHIRFGAHPGYPDREGMGRRSLTIANQREYLDSVLQQIRDFHAEYGGAYIKPHGSLYTDTAQPIALGWDSMAKYPTATSPYEAGGLALSGIPGTGMLIMALRITRLPLMGLSRTMHEPISHRAGVPFIREGFADRAYRSDGTLLPRSEPGAILAELATIRPHVLSLANEVDSICIHGDTPGCVELAQAIYTALVDAGCEVRA